MECRDRKMMQVTLPDELHYRIGQLSDPAAGDCLALLGLLAKLTFELEDEVTRPVTNQTLTLLYDGLGRLIGLRNSLSPTGDEYGELNKEIRNYTQTMVMLIGWEFAAKPTPVAQAQPCECDEPVAADEEPLEPVSVTPIEEPIEYMESTPEAEPPVPEEPCDCCQGVEATPATEPCDCCEAVEASPAEEPCECADTTPAGEPCECAEATPAEEPCECAEAAPAEEPCECAEATPAGGACECTEATPTEEPRECAPAADGEETGEPA